MPSTLIIVVTHFLILACSSVGPYYRFLLQANSTSPNTEGLNGRLPNQDLINSLRLISHYTGGVPLVLYDHLEMHEAPQRSLLENAPNFMKRSPQLRGFEYRARNVKRHVSYQARGRPSGAHGLFHRCVFSAIRSMTDRLYLAQIPDRRNYSVRRSSSWPSWVLYFWQVSSLRCYSVWVVILCQNNRVDAPYIE